MVDTAFFDFSNNFKYRNDKNIAFGIWMYFGMMNPKRIIKTTKKILERF